MEQLQMQRPVPEHRYLRRYARDGEALFNFEPQHIAVPGDGSLEIRNAHSTVVMPELQIVTHARASFARSPERPNSRAALPPRIAARCSAVRSVARTSA